jgi:hypothetical protein
VELNVDVLNFNMSLETVDVVIGQLLFLDDDELAAASENQEDVHAAYRAAKIQKLKRGAMALIKQQKNGSYQVQIKNVVRFQLAIAHISDGVSFRQKTAVIDQTRSVLNHAKLTGIMDSMVGQFVRVLVGATIQKIGDILHRADV